MKGKYWFLAAMLALSGAAMALCGMVIKFAILEPRGLALQDSVVALPFILMRDEGLQYVLSDMDAEQTLPSVTETVPVPTDPSLETDCPTPPATELRRDVLEQVLFIGDSRTCGLRDHARLDGADYFCDVGMMVFNAGTVRLSDESFHSQTLMELLAEREYTCVVISLGLNEAGYPMGSLIRAYQNLVRDVVQCQPQALIVLQGVMNVTRNWAEKTPYASPKNIAAINQRIAELTDGYRSFYIDPNDRFTNAENYLPDNMTADGCHLYARYTSLWSDWICTKITQIDK